MKKIISLFIIIGFFVIMLIFPQQTFEGASNGLLLWFQIILPTLLPFIILSNLLIHTNAVTYISTIVKPFVQRLFRVSDCGCYAIFVGFLCGYPMGAKVVADLIRAEKISGEEGNIRCPCCGYCSKACIWQADFCDVYNGCGRPYNDGCDSWGGTCHFQSYGRCSIWL